MARPKTTKKQTRLAFASTSGPSGAASPEQSSRYSTLQYSNPSSGIYRAKPHKIKTEPKSNPRDKPKKQSRLPTEASQIAPRLSGTIKEGPDESSDNIPLSQRRRAALSNTNPFKVSKSGSSKNSARGSRYSNMDSGNMDNSEELSSSRQKLKRKATSSPIVLSDSDEPIIPLSAQKRRNQREESTPVKPYKEEEDEEDSDDPIQSSAVKRLRRGQEQRVPLEPREEEDSDSDRPTMPSPAKRLRRTKQLPTPQTPRTPRNTSDQAKLDIEEDLEDLQDSVVRKSRTRGHVAESARDKRLRHLETLRRRRAGLKEEESDQESEEESDFNSDVQEIDQNGNQVTPSTRNPRWKHPQDVDSDVESAIDANEDLDRYEDDFVLEDEQNDLGVPTEDIPLEFTRHAYKQPKDYFRDVVYWMVQNKLNPAFPRSDPMFKMAFAKLEDEVKGRSGSQLISSVWSPEFIYAIQARPSMEVTSYPTEEDHPCDACRRSGHPASSDLKPYGKAYSLETLEPLNDDSDYSDEQPKEKHESDDDDDSNERDRDGHVIPPEGTHFYLGRTCKGRAVLAHTLTHWRYHLNEWVIDYLDGMGHMHADEILRRNDMSTKKKTRNANDVLDQMVERGIVDGLWRDFHISLRSAREKESIFA